MVKLYVYFYHNEKFFKNQEKINSNDKKKKNSEVIFICVSTTL